MAVKRGPLVLAMVLLIGACAPPAASPAPRGEAGYGVVAGGPIVGSALLAVLRDLGARWVRVNAMLDPKAPRQDIRTLLDGGVNVVLTLNHRDAANIDTRYGSTREWPEAGFPYRSRETYQERVRALLAPYTRDMAEQHLFVQIENEVGDAGESSVGGAKFWRGTTDQYLSLLDAAYETVKAIDEKAVVVMSGFAGGTLDAAIDPKERTHEYQVRRLTRLLGEGRYDAADLHFYQCTETIAQRSRFVIDRLPTGRRWISTENGGPDFRCAGTPLRHDTDPTRFEAIEAEQVRLRLRACADAGGAVCLWFSLMDMSGETDVFRDLGLLDNPYWPKPGPTATPVRPPRQKPAYAAFKAFVAGAR